MEPVNKVPGLTFHVEKASLKEKHGNVVLEATVNDSDLWDEVLKKLEGLRIYAVADFQTALVECLQDEVRDEKSARAKEAALMREELERTKQELSVLKARQAEMDEENKRFKDVEEELKKLSIHGIEVK